MLKFRPSTTGPTTSKETEMVAAERILRNTLVQLDPSRTWRKGYEDEPVKEIKKEFEVHSLVDHVVGQLVISGFNSHEARSARSRVSYVRSTEGTNVLAYGFTYSKETFQGKVGGLKNMPIGVMRTAGVSSNLASLKGGAWRMIHSVIGDECFVRLLKDAVVVCRVEGEDGCYGVDGGEGIEGQEKGGLEEGYKDKQNQHNYFQLAGIPLFVQAPNYGVSGIAGKPLKWQGSVEEKVGKEVREGKRMKVYEGKGMDVLAKETKTDEGKEGEGKSKFSSRIGDRDTFIPRFKIFYSNSFSKKPGLPTGHPWNKPVAPGLIIKLGKESARVVWNGSRKGKKICEMLEGIMESMVKRHKKMDYGRVIQRHCPLGRKWERRNKPQGGNKKLEIKDVSKMFSDKGDVAEFVKECVERVCPKELFGTEGNWGKIIKGLDEFVKARTTESFDVRMFAEGIKTSEVPWLSTKHKPTPSQSNLANVRLQNAVHFLYASYVIPVIRACFYVTETEFGQNECFWYRKPIWLLFRAMSMDKFSKAQYVRMEEEEIDKKLTEGAMGPGGLRLKPKESGVRGLVTLSKLRGVRGKVYKGWEAKQKSTNHVLGPTHEVLKYEHKMKEDIFGYGVQGFKEVFEKMVEFNDRLGGRGGGRKKLYWASCDIRHCFDTIDPPRVFRLCDELLKEVDYIVRKYSVLHCYDSEKRVVTNHVKEVIPQHAYVRDFIPAISKKYNHAVLIDKVTVSVLHRTKVLEQLKEHLEDNVVVGVGGRGEEGVYRQVKGIAQGSVLSTFLCHLYYGDVEKKLLGGVFGKGGESLVVRYVDDFLCVSENKEEVEEFLTKMTHGDGELGAVVNQDKTVSSFETPLSSKVVKVEEGEAFPFAGYLFDTQTMETRTDFSRFDGRKAIDGLTVERCNKPGLAIITKIKTFVRPRIEELTVSTIINSRERVRANVYENFLLAGVKTVGYVEGMGGGVQSNAVFVRDCVVDLFSYVHSLIQKRVQGQKKKSLSKEEVFFLGYRAFVKVLRLKVKRGGGTWRELLAMMEEGGRGVVVKNEKDCIDGVRRGDKEFRVEENFVF